MHLHDVASRKTFIIFGHHFDLLDECICGRVVAKKSMHPKLQLTTLCMKVLVALPPPGVRTAAQRTHCEFIGEASALHTA